MFWLNLLVVLTKISAWLHISSRTKYHEFWFVLLGEQLTQEGYRVESHGFLLSGTDFYPELLVYTQEKTFVFWVKANILTADPIALSNAIGRDDAAFGDLEGVIVCESSIPERIQEDAKEMQVQVKRGIKGIKDEILACTPTKSIVSSTI